MSLGAAPFSSPQNLSGSESLSRELKPRVSMGGNEPGPTPHVLLTTEINSWNDGHMSFMHSEVGMISRPCSGRLWKYNGNFVTDIIPWVPIWS